MIVARLSVIRGGFFTLSGAWIKEGVYPGGGADGMGVEGHRARVGVAAAGALPIEVHAVQCGQFPGGQDDRALRLEQWDSRSPRDVMVQVGHRGAQGRWHPARIPLRKGAYTWPNGPSAVVRTVGMAAARRILVDRDEPLPAKATGRGGAPPVASLASSAIEVRRTRTVV